MRFWLNILGHVSIPIGGRRMSSKSKLQTVCEWIALNWRVNDNNNNDSSSKTVNLIFQQYFSQYGLVISADFAIAKVSARLTPKMKLLNWFLLFLQLVELNQLARDNSMWVSAMANCRRTRIVWNFSSPTFGLQI